MLISSTGGPYRRQDVSGRCPICGARNATCGGPTSHVPIDIPSQQIDIPSQQEEGGVSGPLRIYHVKIAGRRVLFRLSQTDAQRLAGTPASGEADREAAEASTEATAEKARQPSNKAKTPPNKAQPAP